jgi:hypothetical protein
VAFVSLRGQRGIGIAAAGALLALRALVPLFGPFNIDPDDYDGWVDRVAANMRVAPDLVK